MELKFNVTGAKRKELVTAMSEILEVKPKYLGMPTAAYEVDYFTVDKVGTVSFDDRADSEEVENLLDSLAEKGFVVDLSADKAGENQRVNDTPLQEQADTGETVGLTIEMPRDYFNETTLANLENLISSKATLIKKALGIEKLPIETTDEKVIFPWFELKPTEESIVSAYTKFISSLCEMANKQKRINAKEKEVDNEKYAFRCFLLRLGFIGENYKIERKILLKNFSGSAAFKGKNYRVELANDEFKIFTAPNKTKAQEIAWQIAEEYGSEFSELHEEVE